MDQKKETQPDQQTIDEILNLLKSGKLNNAKIKIENCIKKFPKSFVLFNILGAVYVGQDQLEVAINYHKKSIEINLIVKGKMKIRNKILKKDDIFILNKREVADPKFILTTHIVCVKTPAPKNDKYCAITHKRI